MKIIGKLLISILCVASAGCTMVNPYENWGDEGLHAADRLLPSDLKAALCSQEWWKAEYAEKSLYFSFEEEGIARSSSTMNEATVNTGYHLNWLNDYEVEIKFDKETHLALLADGFREQSLVVTSFTDSTIVAKGTENGTEIIFAPASEEEYSAMESFKLNYILVVENESYKIGQDAGELRVKITGGDWTVAEPAQNWLKFERRDGDVAVFSYAAASHRFRSQEVEVSQVDPDGNTSSRTFVVSGTDVMNFTQTFAVADFSGNEALKEVTELTLEALICPTAFPNMINTIMGVEGKFLIRLGDSGYPSNQVQLAFAGGKSSPGALAEIEKDAWTHLAVTMDPKDGNIRFYINGENVYTDAKNVVADITDFKIGRSANYTTRFFTGYMAEIRVWTRALAEAEINAPDHFYAVDPKSDGLLAYWRCDDGYGSSLKDATGHGYNCSGDWAENSNWETLPSAYPLP